MRGRSTTSTANSWLRSPAACDVVAHRLAQREEREVEAAVGRARPSARFPSCRPAWNCANTSMREGSKPSALAVHVQVAAAADGAVAGQHGEMLRRQRVRDEPAGPQMPDAVAPVRRAEHGRADERDGREHGERGRRAHVQRRES